VARKAGLADPVAEVYGSLKLGEPIDEFVRRVRGPSQLTKNRGPTWLKLVIAGACACVIAALAVYSRRRARRAAPSNST